MTDKPEKKANAGMNRDNAEAVNAAGAELAENELDQATGGYQYDTESWTWGDNEKCPKSPDGQHKWVHEMVQTARLPTMRCEYCNKSSDIFR